MVDGNVFRIMKQKHLLRTCHQQIVLALRHARSGNRSSPWQIFEGPAHCPVTTLLAHDIPPDPQFYGRDFTAFLECPGDSLLLIAEFRDF
jgi:hypothetical protein